MEFISGGNIFYAKEEGENIFSKIPPQESLTSILFLCFQGYETNIYKIPICVSVYRK